jgi:polyisoprenoid-binding protein YceI
MKSKFRTFSDLRKQLGLVTAIVTIALFAAATLQSQEHYQVDPATSEVHFALGGAHEVNGTFHVSGGDFTLDRETGVISGTITVDAASGRSDNSGRDKKMTADQMKAQVFPSVTFAPTRFTGQVKEGGDSNVQVQGTFTLLGQPHQITVPMTVHVDNGHYTAAGGFVVPYVSWGMKDPSIMFLKVAKEVKIDLKLAGTVTK